MAKNYIGFVNDHSGSMARVRSAAMADYNANIAAIKEAATSEMLDTVVSVVGIGVNGELGSGSVERQVVISNPHVLKPVDKWYAGGGTPLYDGIGNIIELFQSLPDANKEEVSFLVLVTTDGEEMHSKKYTADSLRRLIVSVQKTQRWTFVFRVPKADSSLSKILALGVNANNIQQWETTNEGMAESTKATTQAMSSFFKARSAGARSTTAFYADATAVNLAQLEDISSKVSLYVVPFNDMGIMIHPFILRYRMDCLKGSCFFQLTKTEPRIQPDKIVIIRDRVTGKMFSGPEARKMIGLPDLKNARLHPGDHKNYDIFIQSKMPNRKLEGGTGVLYWKEIGVPFSEEELSYMVPKTAVPTIKPAVVELPAVSVKTSPTKNPIPVTPRPQVVFYATREKARQEADANGKSVIDLGSKAVKGKRWTIG